MFGRRRGPDLHDQDPSHEPRWHDEGPAFVEHAGVSMDQISYACLDGTTGSRYFVLPNMTALRRG